MNLTTQICTFPQDSSAEANPTKNQRLRTKIYEHRQQFNETAVCPVCIISVPKGVVEVGKRSRPQRDCGSRRMRKVCPSVGQLT